VEVASSIRRRSAAIKGGERTCGTLRNFGLKVGSRDEEGDRGAGASAGRDHAPHMG